jgi:hypothetical protein
MLFIHNVIKYFNIINKYSQIIMRMSTTKISMVPEPLQNPIYIKAIIEIMVEEM